MTPLALPLTVVGLVGLVFMVQSSSSSSLLTISSADMFHLEPLGTMAGTMGYGHMVFDYNITKFITEIEETCFHVRHMWGGKWAPRNAGERRREKMTTALAAECHLLLRDVEEYRQIWFLPRGATSSFSVFVTRPVRQVFILGAIAGAAIVSVFSSLFSGSFLSLLSGQVDSQTATTVSILQQDEIRLTTAEHTEKMLNESILILAKTEEGIRNELGATGAMVLALTAFSTRLSEFRRIFGCLQGLTVNQISPQLFNVTALPTALHNLQTKLHARDYHLALEQIPDLFKCDASYISFNTGIIRIFLHIPAYRRDTIMQVYRFIPIPFELPDYEGDEHFTMSRPARNILAVSDDEADFKILSDAKWASCKAFLGIFYCEGENLYRKGSSANCLMAVYKKDVHDIHQHCRFALSPTKNFALEISSNSVIIFHDKMNEIRLDCFHPRRTEKSSFKGLRKITIPPACRLNGNHFMFDSAVEVYLKPSILTDSFFNISTMFAETDMPDDDMREVYHLLAQAGSKEGLTFANIAAKYKASRHQSLLNWGFGSFSTIASFAFLACGLYVGARWLKRRNRSHQGGVNLNVEMRPLAAAAAAADAASIDDAVVPTSRSRRQDDDES